MTRIFVLLAFVICYTSFPAWAQNSGSGSGSSVYIGSKNQNSASSRSYGQSLSSIASQPAPAKGPSLYNRSSTGGTVQPFNLKGMLNNPDRYGMQTQTYNPYQNPYASNVENNSVGDLHAMAQDNKRRQAMDIEQRSRERMQKLRDLQAYLNAETPSQQSTAPASRYSQRSPYDSSANKPAVRYIYKGTSTEQPSAPPKVFLSNR